MNLKLKFALLFSFLVAIILVSSILVIHFLYSDTRSEVAVGLVLLGSVMLAGCCAFVFVRQVIRPLTRLNEQMKRITANNLRERIVLSKSNNELQQIAASFNAMLERLEKGFEVQKSFVHHASHELRTPLANMLAQTEAALARELDAGEAKIVLQSLREDQQELIELTNSLLLLSQYEKISYSSEWPKVRLDQVLYDTIDLVKQSYPLANCSLSFAEMPEHEQALAIKGNDALLRSACKNLIKNAFQYSSDKNIVITIETGAGFLAVHFDNNGPTLSPAEQDRLFIPFFRGANAMGTKGFGLGLLIVKRIVLLHSGSITYTIPGEGINRFTVHFTKLTA